MRLRTFKQLAVLPLVSALLVACGSDNDSNATTAPPATATPPTTPVQLEISLTNLTAGQPQSPAAVIVHRAGYLAFNEGEAASVALEELAEGGAAQPLLDDALTSSHVVKTYAAPAALAPGGHRTFTMTLDGITSTAGLYLTGLTMLVNTNDAFTGVNNVSLGDLAVGDSLRWNGPVWDAGTELNTEATGTIPGPADGGEGSNSDRNDHNNVVVFHPGVITTAEGLTTSVLDQSHRFDQPAVAVRITRVQ